MQRQKNMKGDRGMVGDMSGRRVGEKKEERRTEK